MSPTVVTLLVAVPAVLAVAGYFLLLRRAPKEAAVYYYTCKGCRRRFGYGKVQMGHAGMCPRCKERFVFPVVRDA